ncbi:hypothetical protein AWM79_10295 [Pseudomonas agarici]|uniref:Uncharacterized protein n=1 Tax=Pseudomonas agarici TaxID=46677 RepID=A0A0X1T0S3_PSEAA|nr:hypothetical protein [Pseudomonas agarici]AMB85667.1 hypothetical protein AWM79_10295 [Pseudomonas agarici]NWB91049.1 hypothetical protein [Pseudomonas agarici]NWC09588.1 hypothetical protein [Pseudomonas agarici]SEL22393.1 hypothetical protein SAMN05216604_11394 [Pseudomonas agarici]
MPDSSKFFDLFYDRQSKCNINVRQAFALKAVGRNTTSRLIMLFPCNLLLQAIFFVAARLAGQA